MCVCVCVCVCVHVCMCVSVCLCVTTDLNKNKKSSHGVRAYLPGIKVHQGLLRRVCLVTPEDREEGTACKKGDHSVHKGDNTVGL